MSPPFDAAGPFNNPLWNIQAAHQGPPVLQRTEEELVAALEELRKPFPTEQIGKLPRTTCRDCSNSGTKVCSKHAKSECKTCGNYMTGAHMHLDYVGHAAVTQRLLEVDPLWSWEPFAMDTDGLPCVVVDKSEAELWIKLTVCGVTRPGVGTCPANSFESKKQLIGDALRNAAMRFGVALDLWSKEELHPPDDKGDGPRPASGSTKKASKAAPSRGKPAGAYPNPGPQAEESPAEHGPPIDSTTAIALFLAMDYVVNEQDRKNVKGRFAKRFGGAPEAVTTDRLGEAWQFLEVQLEMSDHGYEDGGDSDGVPVCGVCGSMVRAPWHTDAPESPQDAPGASAEGSDAGSATEPYDEVQGADGGSGPDTSVWTVEWIASAPKAELVEALVQMRCETDGAIGVLRSRLTEAVAPF